MTDKDKWILDQIKSGRYSVSRSGIVTSHRYYGNEGKSGEVKGHVQESGYVYVMLENGGIKKNCRLNRVVALMYLPNPERLRFVNHRDGDKSNNNDWNLEWCSQSGNEIHAYETGLKIGQFGDSNPAAKITEVQAIEVKKLAVEGSFTQKEIAAMYGIKQSQVSRIKTGVRRSDL